MDRGIQHERTLRLLEAKLEDLACASEHSLSARLVDAHVDAAVTATRHAVELDLISPAEADEVWTRVARRHPDLRWCRERRSRAA